MSTATATATAFTNTAYSLLYRGNSINGWLSAFLTYVALRQQGKEDIRFVPLCGHRVIASSEAPNWAGTHVLMLDMDNQDPTVLLGGGVLSVESISATASTASTASTTSAAATTAAAAAPVETSTVMDVWRRWYGEALPPFWLSSVDRMTRWATPMWEDRCLREILMPVAHMAPADALLATDALMTWMMNPMGVEFQNLMTQGQARLMEKDLALGAFLKEKGKVHEITASDTATWGLTDAWVGLKAFLLENHDTVLDTNEAAHLVFMNYPEVGIFVNYRKKVRKMEGSHPTRKLGLVYVYSARSKAFDLTTGGFFQGRAGSAGAQIAMDRETMPFVPFVSEIMNI